MKILIVSTLKRKIAPDETASRSRIIFEIAQGMVKKGHEVTILGTGDSIVPGATIIPIIPKQFIDLGPFENPFYAETSYLVTLAKKIEEIGNNHDIIHNHTYPEFINLLSSKNIKTPMVTTVHVQVTPEVDEVLSLFPNTHLISISKAHLALFKKTKIDKVVYNGVDTNLYSFEEKKEDYLFWLGRLSKAKNADGSFMDPKGVKWAIQLARETNSRLKLSGNVEDLDFFNTEVKPFLNDKIEWIGPVSKQQALTKEQVISLMQKAKAFLMTINWYEPFGLVMAEAGSCGTPVIAFNRGSVPELIENEKTGYVVSPEAGIDGLKAALAKVSQIKSADCRARIIELFSLEAMINNYEKTYQEIVSKP